MRHLALFLVTVMACCAPRPAPPDQVKPSTHCDGACKRRIELADAGCPAPYSVSACVEACEADEEQIPGVMNAPCVEDAGTCDALRACANAER